LQQLADVMQRLARGDFDAVIPRADRQDEIGAMARAVEVLKDAGLKKQRLEAEAVAQRSMTEMDRLAAEEGQGQVGQGAG
jgi:methyl-accepting chemotaxis protein